MKKFPSVDTLAYYHPLGNYIYLYEYADEADLLKVKEKPGSDRNRFSIYIHETQHYLDQVSTLWVIHNIFRIFRAFHTVFFGTESDLHNYRKLNLSIKKDYFLDYYTQAYNQIHGTFQNPWKFQMTTGLRFDHNGAVDATQPIPLITFSDADDDKVCRVPLSVASLLETRATSAELRFQISEILKLNSPFKENQINQLNKRIEDKVYHPDLALYSVAVFLSVREPIAAYKISSVFAKIALNVPSGIFEKVLVPDEFNQSADWRLRVKYLLKNGDRGFLFYLLIRNYSDKHGPLQGMDISVDDSLAASCLPDEQTLEELISKEVQELDANVLLDQNSFNRQISEKIFFGNRYRKASGIGQQRNADNLSDLFRDKLYFLFSPTDFEYDSLVLEPIVGKAVRQEELSREEWFRIYTYCEQRIDSFDRICGI